MNIINCVNVGVGVLGPSTVCEMVDCEVSGGGSAVYVGSHCYLNTTQTIFHGGYWSVVEMNGGILFDPFVGGSVPTEKMSFDSLKAMFR